MSACGRGVCSVRSTFCFQAGTLRACIGGPVCNSSNNLHVWQACVCRLEARSQSVPLLSCFSCSVVCCLLIRQLAAHMLRHLFRHVGALCVMWSMWSLLLSVPAVNSGACASEATKHSANLVRVVAGTDPPPGPLSFARSAVAACMRAAAGWCGPGWVSGTRRWVQGSYCSHVANTFGVVCALAWMCFRCCTAGVAPPTGQPTAKCYACGCRCYVTLSRALVHVCKSTCPFVQGEGNGGARAVPVLSAAPMGASGDGCKPCPGESYVPLGMRGRRCWLLSHGDSMHAIFIGGVAMQTRLTRRVGSSRKRQRTQVADVECPAWWHRTASQPADLEAAAC